MIRKFDTRDVQSLTYDRQDDGSFLVTLKARVKMVEDSSTGELCPAMICLQYRVGRDMMVELQRSGDVRRVNGELVSEITTLEVRTTGAVRALEGTFFEKVWFEQ